VEIGGYEEEDASELATSLRWRTRKTGKRRMEN
jgi:hypothetical protein